MDKRTDPSSLMHNISENTVPLFSKKTIGLLLVVTLFGLGSGYYLARAGSQSGNNIVGKLVNKAEVPAGKTYGSTDTKTYKDTAEGTLKEGGIADEGQYHLARPGGESQNVYLTSSLVDMSKFLDRKIKVWGQTQKAQTAGWLMDVGRIEVLE
jgi:hypothetical protein